MKTYIVGGAVRDELLGVAVKDRDYVVVGATPEQMIAQGYTPVGKDFPVFLHPVTHEEYALARTERKTAPGYKGFVFHTDAEVTLEEDLIRRDLTVNAMAKDADGIIVDPFNGKQDLAQHIFRHVSPAFTEDPVRILRVARFAARFPQFSVAAETNTLMHAMVAAGEVDALVPERVWQELARGLMEQQPSRMFAVLRDCGALKRILPELDILWGVPQPALHHPEIDTGVHVMMVVDYAAQKNCSLPIRCAALLHDLGKGVTSPELWPKHHGHEMHSAKLVEVVCQRLKIPNDSRDLALMTAREHGNIGRALELRAATIVSLFERCDAFRKPQRFIDMLQAAECDHRGRNGFADKAFPQNAYLQKALNAAQTVNGGELAALTRQRYPDQPARIPDAIREARVKAVAAAINEAKTDI